MDWNTGSSGDNYRTFCKEAALSTSTFNTFRRNPNYTGILEHVNQEQGKLYLNHIKAKGLTEEEILNSIRKLQIIGGPHLLDVGLKELVSTTALRYLHVSLEIKKHYGERIDRIVEIGAGYGGLGVILSGVVNIREYICIDLQEVNMLINRFLAVVKPGFKYCAYTLNNIEIDYSDLVIANYSFSELNRSLQREYMRKVLFKSSHGYMTMNSGLNKSENFSHYTLEEIKHIMPYISRYQESPLTSKDNYVIRW